MKNRIKKTILIVFDVVISYCLIKRINNETSNMKKYLSFPLMFARSNHTEGPIILGLSINVKKMPDSQNAKK